MNLITSTEPGELAQLRIRVRLLKEMATHINAGLDVQQLVERTLLEAHKSLPEFRISYCTSEGDGKLKVPTSVAPINMPSIEGKQFEVGQSEVVARVLRGGGHVAIFDVESDERAAGLRAMAKAVHTRAMLIMPIRHPQQALAFLIFASAQPHQWSDYEIEILADMAEYLAIAIRERWMQNERAQVDRHLRESQKMEAVGRLVGGVAHDFNNLLTGMMIYSGLLSTALGQNSPLQRHVRELQSAGERGASLVAQLLSLSRDQVLEPRLLCLNDVVSGMREMLQRLVGEDVLIECHLAGDLSFSRLDENQLRQTILNLAINARDAMKTGGRLGLTTTHVTVGQDQGTGLAPGEYAVLSVSDTGAGMSEETLAHCFEPFYTTKPVGQGTGLGLAAVYGMLKQHGGHVTVSSALGEGTTIDLYFPIATSGAEFKALRGETGQRRLTVMLVEDEDLLRLPLAETLKQEGFHVLNAPSPVGALEVAHRFRGVIDLLITDLVMPEMSGVDLAERMKVLRPGMPVLYMSGYTNDPRARRLIAEGAEFLRKPFNAQTFAHKVKELTEHDVKVRAGRTLVRDFERDKEEQQKSISSLGKET